MRIFCIQTSAASGTYDVWVTIVEVALATELALDVEGLLGAALGVVGPFLRDSLAADLFDDVIGRVDAIYGVDGTTVDVVFPVIQSSLAADLFHVVVRPTVAAGRVWNCR